MNTTTHGLAGWVGRAVVVRIEVVGRDGWMCVGLISGVLTPGATEEMVFLLGEDTILLVPDSAEMSYEPPFLRFTADEVRFSMALDATARSRR